jgi:hypothetical protein
MVRNAIQQLQNDYAELFAGKEIRETENGKFSVYDYLRTVTEYKNPYDIYTRLCNQYPEVVEFCEDFQFPGKGQRNTPVTTRQGLLLIHGLLPGQAGSKYRQNTAEIIERFLRGDVTLAEQIIAQTEDNTTRAAVIATDRLNNDQDRLTVAEAVIDNVQSTEVAQEIAERAKTKTRYLGSYHGLHETIKDHGGVENSKRKDLPYSQRTSTHKIVNAINTRSIGKTPIGNRKHFNTEELNQLTVIQDLQKKRIEKHDVQGHEEIVPACSFVADRFAEFKRLALG